MEEERAFIILLFLYSKVCLDLVLFVRYVIMQILSNAFLFISNAEIFDLTKYARSQRGINR